MCLGNFLVMNLFDGVIVSTFNKEKDILGKNFLLTEKQKKWLEQKKNCLKISPKVILDKHPNPIINIIRRVVTDEWFENFI